MKKQMLFLLLAMSMPLFAQTTHTFYADRDSSCSLTQNYITCDDMGFDTPFGSYIYNGIPVNGAVYTINAVATVPNVYLYPANASIIGGDVSIQDITDGLGDYTYGMIAATSTYQNYVVTYQFGPSSGALAFNSGTLTFTLTRTFYGFRHYPSYHAHNAVITLVY